MQNLRPSPDLNQNLHFKSDANYLSPVKMLILIRLGVRSQSAFLMNSWVMRMLLVYGPY